jgi:MFS family permease
LFALAFGGTAISWFALTALVELPEPVENGTPQQLSAIAHARHVVRSDRAFRLVTVVRLLAGLTGLALPFYVVHATRELGLPASFVGLAVGVQNIIAVLGSITLGALAERAGTARVIQVSALASAIAPLTALLLHILRPEGGSYTSLISAGYVLVFALLSAIDCSILLGYLNYVMEIAPPGERAAYVGLTNTISGLLVVLPVLGGALLQATSYPVLFAVAATGAVLGLLLSLRLPSQETR